VLRTATEPMTVREIAAAVLAAKGVTDATHKQVRDLEAGLRSSLENNAARPSNASAKAFRSGGR
jgi:hypothetical protein